MKKTTSFLTVMSMVIVMFCTTPVYAMEVNTDPAEAVVVVSSDDVEDTAVPYGTLNGYGQKWHNPAVDGDHGTFFIDVKGAPWINAHCTISFENFRDDTEMELWFYSPITDGNGKYQLLYHSDNIRVGDFEFDNQQFNPGTVGTYTIQYKIKKNNCPGRINCWIW